MTINLDEIAALLAKAESDEHSLPPVEKWHPPLSGQIDMQILADGRWIHEGDEIKRPKLVKLFSTILRREGDEYFLVTPVEKWQLCVQDAPFYAGVVELIDDHGMNKLAFTTNVGSTVIASAEHPLRVLVDASTGEPHPYVLVRNNLEALIGRSAFYQLVNWAQEKDGKLTISSAGVEFVLGAL